MEKIDFSYFWWNKEHWDLESYLEIVKVLGDSILKTIFKYREEHFLDPGFVSRLNAFSFTFPYLLSCLKDDDVPKLFFNHMVYFEELCRDFNLDVIYMNRGLC